MPEDHKKPLDIDEVVVPQKESKPTTRGTLLELIPMTLIAIGLYLRYKGMSYAMEFLITGGALASLMYLLFSWYMFKVQEYKSNEVVLSILVGLIFPLGIVGLLFKMESWVYAEQLMYTALIGAGTLFVISFALFLYHFKDERASVFYRNVLTRLLVFAALLLALQVF